MVYKNVPIKRIVHAYIHMYVYIVWCVGIWHLYVFPLFLSKKNKTHAPIHLLYLTLQLLTLELWRIWAQVFLLFIQICNKQVSNSYVLKWTHMNILYICTHIKIYVDTHICMIKNIYILAPKLLFPQKRLQWLGVKSAKCLKEIFKTSKLCFAFSYYFNLFQLFAYQVWEICRKWVPLFSIK